MIIHIVMFKFKDENKSDNIYRAVQMLKDLRGLVPALKSIEVGTDFNQSDRAFDLSIYTSFESKEDLKAYALHPAHLKVLDFIKAVTLKSHVVDYEK